MSSFHCQLVLQRKRVFNWSMLLTAFVVRIPVGPWHLHLSSQTALTRALRTWPGPLGNASRLVKPQCARRPLGWGGHKAPHTAQSSCEILESERRRGPLTKTEKKLLQKTNHANDALTQTAHLHKGPKQRFFPGSEACIYSTLSSFGITGIKSWRMSALGCSMFLIRSANGDVLMGGEVLSKIISQLN